MHPIMKKILCLILTIFFFSIISYSQEETKTALLIIDIQNFYFTSEEYPGLVNALEASENAKKVLEKFREQNELVIHVRHKSENGFEIHKNVAPLANEKIFTKTAINSFVGTELLDYLKENRVSQLVIIGMQTHMCVEAAVRAAKDYGFNCIVIDEACATRDLEYEDKIIKASDVHASTLETFVYGGYAKVVHIEEFLNNTEKYIQ